MQRRIRAVVVLRDRPDVPPGHREVEVYRRLPGRTGNVTPVRIDSLAGEAEQAGAVVSVRPGERGRLEVLRVGSVDGKQQTAELCWQSQLVGELGVHTAHEGGTNVDVGLLDVTSGGNGIASDAAGVRLAHDLVAKGRKVRQTVAHDDACRDNIDLAIERDVEVVRAAAERRDCLRCEREARGPGLALL